MKQVLSKKVICSAKPMTEDQLKAFWEHAKSNQDIQNTLKDAKDLEAIAKIANDAGFSIDVDSLKQTKEVLTDRDLEYISGGTMCTPISVSECPTFATCGDGKGCSKSK